MKSENEAACNEADEHLLKLIADHDGEGWRQFVTRFQGRLLAFATRQIGSTHQAEDLVQETFVSFLASIDGFRRQCELESFLFQILRRRIADCFRKQGRRREVPVCAFALPENESPIDLAASPQRSPDLEYEMSDRFHAAHAGLASAIGELAGRLRAAKKFRDLMIAEGVFFAGRPNSDIAKLISVSANEVAVVKRRMIAKLADHLRSHLKDDESEINESSLEEGLLSRVWRQLRPSCPKRSTLGKYSLEILPDDWQDFVTFHVETLGCRFCLANLDELQLDESSPPESNDRLFQSTIGFFRSH